MDGLNNHLYTLYILGTNHDPNWSVYSNIDKEHVISKGARKDIIFAIEGLVIKVGEKDNSIFIADEPSWLNSNLNSHREYSLLKILSDPDLQVYIEETLALAGCELKISLSD
ncbi:MAG TPA: hypothetical protein VFD55_01890 [Candidatus Angelobacter sp.]|nr:hypothetical protein [Candidatus Angelobacter sp.]